MDKLNTPIKVLSIVALVTLTLSQGNNFIKNTHFGPSCNLAQMQHWIKSDSTKGKIVSIHQNKVQLKAGSTTCSGVFKTSKGYADWVGEISNIDGGQIGFAKVR